MRIRKPTTVQLLKGLEKDYPPPTKAEAQALLEMKQLTKEANAFEKRRKQLSKKWKEGTITKQEKSEMDRLYGKDSNAMVNKLIAGAAKFRKATIKK
jgi:hypothetical protein